MRFGKTRTKSRWPLSVISVNRIWLLLAMIVASLFVPLLLTWRTNNLLQSSSNLRQRNSHLSSTSRNRQFDSTTLIDQDDQDEDKMILSNVVKDKRILVFSHDLSATGAPKIKVETVYLLLKASAKEVAFSMLPALHTSEIKHALSRDDVEQAEEEVRNLMKRLLIGGEELLDRVKIIVPADIHMASRFDVIMASTMHPAMVDWITKFRESYADYNRLLWWLHEGKAGSDQLGGTKAAVDLIRAGHINALGWDSLGSQSFWMGAMQHNKYWGEIPHPERAVQWGLLDMKRERMDLAMKDDKAKNELRKKLGIKKGDIVVVMLCSNNPHKGVTQAIEAFSQTIADENCGRSKGKAHMIVAGLGFSENYLSKISKEHLSHVVHVLPATLHPEAILAIGHIFVSNALNGGENWGLSCIEAMSAGMAILATKGSGGLEQVHHGVNGLHHDMDTTENNVKQLKDNLCMLVHDDFGLAKRMGQKSRKRVVELFNEDKMTKELGELLYYTLKRDESMSGMKKRKEEDATFIGSWTEHSDMVSPTHAVEAVAIAIYNERTGKLKAVYSAGGYLTFDIVSDTLRKWDATTEKWSTVRKLLPGMPQTHIGTATDGRFLFWVGGQVGSRCSPATDAVWAYDTGKDEFIAMAPLPEARYSPEVAVVTQANDPSLLAGEAVLHVISGFGPDRMSPIGTHWVMKIRGAGQKGDELLDVDHQVWTEISDELPYPTGHIAALLHDHHIYVFGVMRDHNPVTECYARFHKFHKVYGDVHANSYYHIPAVQRYDLIRKRWTRLADMPIPISHCPIVKHGSKVLVLGGTGQDDKLRSTMQEYDLEKDEWHVSNRTMPKSQFLKGGVAWLHDGRVFYSCGQSGNEDRYPVTVRKETYSATIF